MSTGKIKKVASRKVKEKRTGKDDRNDRQGEEE